MSLTGEELKTRRPGTRRRIPFVALLFAFLSPVIGMLYVGRPVRAAMYLVIGFLIIGGAFLVSRAGWWPAGLSWGVLFLAIRGACMADAFRIARQYQTAFAGPWYTTWYGLVAIAVALIVLPLSFRAFLYEPFRQASGSMLPTLVANDHLFVSKGAYRREPPQRGDIVIFLVPGTSVYYVKRVIGLPGDMVDYDAGERRLTINGVEAAFETLGSYDAAPEYQLARERIDGAEHLVLHIQRNPSADGLYRVPDGHYFMLGDNRDNSEDSRFPSVGYIPAENIVGKVVLVWWNTDEPARAGIVPR